MNRFRFLLLTSLFLLLALASTGVSLKARPADTNPGSAAPPVELEKLLQAPAGAKADLPSLKGNVVVLEFWATWCAPCIAAMPHLNELTEQFRDKPVKFISITDQDEATVAPFLSRRKIASWVGLDLDRSVFEAYEANLIPRTVVVDREGKIASVDKPMSLTAEKLNQLLAGKPSPSALDKTTDEAKPMPLNAAQREKASASTEPPQARVTPLKEEKELVNDEPPQLSMAIKPSKASRGQIDIGPSRFRASGVGLKYVLRTLYSMNELRIEVPAQLQPLRYDITATVKDGKISAVNQFVVHSLETMLGIKVQRVTREVEVYVLTAPGPLTGALKPSLAPASSGSRIGSARGVLTAMKAEIKFLANGIEEVLKLPVIDETNLQGKYDWDTLYDAENPNSIIEAVRKELGLELKRSRRAIEILVVEAN